MMNVFQYPGLCRLRVRHGRDRAGLHRTLQRAEITGLHLDARARGEGAQTQVYLLDPYDSVSERTTRFTGSTYALALSNSVDSVRRYRKNIVLLI